jgi:DNA invertase Pin-like site-specific DNA recombinase
MTKQPKLRAAVYARVSTRDQNTKQQLRELRAYCAARGWQLAGEFVDHGVSGKKASRPEMDKLIALARQRKIDAVIVWKIDRWGRSIQHFVSSVQELNSLGVRFVATTQGIDTDKSNPGSKLLLHILVCFAEFEHDLIVERTLAGLATARKGGRIGGRPKKILDRQKVLDLRDQGWPTRKIAQHLSSTVKGGVSHVLIARILKAAA